MSDKNHNFRSLVCVYSQLLPEIRETAKRLGYAIAIHGSMSRDLDLLAVPWVYGACTALDLIEAISVSVDGFVIGDTSKGNLDNYRGRIPKTPTENPHGRQSWNICWGGEAFIDISVMPRKEDWRTYQLLQRGPSMSTREKSIIEAVRDDAARSAASAHLLRTDEPNTVRDRLSLISCVLSWVLQDGTIADHGINEYLLNWVYEGRSFPSAQPDIAQPQQPT